MASNSIDKETFKAMRQSSLFDATWYKNKYELKKLSDDEALEHYLTAGWLDQNDPGPEFSSSEYLSVNEDVKRAKINPLAHYIKSGSKEGRKIRIQLDGQQPYLRSDLPRFGGREYGPISKIYAFDNCESIISLTRPSLCVQLHLFHHELASEFIITLKSIRTPFTLLVSTTHPIHPELLELFESELSEFASIKFKEIPNRGRDVAPWIVHFAEDILAHDILIHIHTKKSIHSDSLRDWKRYLLHTILGSEGIFNRIFNDFIRDSNLGLVYPAYFPALSNQPKWGANLPFANEVLRKINLPPITAPCPDYPAGSFYWARTKSLKQLLDGIIELDDFPEESGQIDGTLQHAIERLLVHICQYNGYRSQCSTIDVAYNLTNYWSPERINSIAASHAEKERLLPATPSTSSRSIALITCITDKFDSFIGHESIDKDIDYYLVTNSDFIAPYPFQRLPTLFRDKNPRKVARHCKTHPHLYTHGYRYAVWIDGNIEITASILPLIERVSTAKVDAGLILHPIRNSYFKEAEECIQIGADDKTTLKRQIEAYRLEGIPEDYLIETNFMILDLNSEATKNFMKIWWQEIFRYSIRDQVSVRKAIMLSGLKFVNIVQEGNSLRDTPGFRMYSHNQHSREAIRLLASP